MPLQATAQTPEAQIIFKYESTTQPQEVYRPYKSEIPKVVKKNVGGSKFGAGYCTDYVARRKAIPWHGNARSWIANSKAFGATVDKTPTVGAILQTNESRIGHVAYIVSVDGDYFTFGEWNYAGRYKETYRTFHISDPRIVGIIHY